MKIEIAHLYPDLLNLYGDKGNIMSLVKRLEWRRIEANIRTYLSGETIDFENTDIIVLGGGTLKEQLTVCDMLKEVAGELNNFVHNGGTLLATCGGFEILGKYYETENATVECLGILDTYTVAKKDRVIGNVVVKPSVDEIGMNIVGFENHNTSIFINNHQPLGEVVIGEGNNDGIAPKREGVIYKNVFATSLHGPLLPKNPMLCDYILTKTIAHKYNDTTFKLDKLDDTLEIKANDFINKLLI